MNNNNIQQLEKALRLAQSLDTQHNLEVPMSLFYTLAAKAIVSEIMRIDEGYCFHQGHWYVDLPINSLVLHEARWWGDGMAYNDVTTTIIKLLGLKQIEIEEKALLQSKQLTLIFRIKKFLRLR